jgi:mRNA-degrading endonuclease RelE of RelBE toxin-antitoxin system
MRYVFFETPLFSRLLPSYLDDVEYGRLQSFLMREPERGNLMPATGGFRKLRWADSRRHKGRRGGLRVIYYVLSTDKQIWLFTIYDKDEMKDLTAQQCRALRHAIYEELIARRETL